MKKSIFSISFTDSTIYGSKSALKKASNPNTDEHKALMKILAEHPTFKVVEKEPNANKNTYKGMDFKMMRNYINAQPNAKELMDEFDMAVAMFNGKYPLVKKWFLEQYGNEFKAFQNKMKAKKEAAKANNKE